MRTKTFVVFLICVIGTSLFLILFGSQRPSIQTLVQQTNKQLTNLQKFKENLEDVEENRLVADDKYLNLLGFTESPRLYPAAIWKNTSLPIIVTYVLEGQESQGAGLARSAARHLPDHSVLVYDLGLGSEGGRTLRSHCNGSRCSVVAFDLGLFPSHVAEERLHAFRPLVIQDALNRAGAVLFLDCSHRLLTGRIEPLIGQAMEVGVVTWATRHAASSLTHPRMFDYFRARADDFLFLPMVEADKMLLYNTATVHSRVMLPWVQCALTRDCVHPIGAQDGGCRFNKKPQYRYSGCHRYDGSALNIVLGLEFNFDETKYTNRSRDEYVRRVTAETAAAEMAEMNGTETTSGV